MKISFPISPTTLGAILAVCLFVGSVGASYRWYEAPGIPAIPVLHGERAAPDEEVASVLAESVPGWPHHEGRRSLFPSGKEGKGSERRSGATGEQRRDAPELAYVRVETPPLRLVGRIGSSREPKPLGIFAIAATGETVVAGAGHAFAGLGLTLERMELARAEPGGQRSPDVAKAWIRDTLSGRIAVLNEGDETDAGAPVAGLKAKGGGDVREARVGDTVNLAGREWRVRQIRVAPPSVEIDGPEGEVLRLEPQPAPSPRARTVR